MNNVSYRVRTCLHEGGGPHVDEVACGGLPNLTCKRDKIKTRDYTGYLTYLGSPTSM